MVDDPGVRTESTAIEEAAATHGGDTRANIELPSHLVLAQAWCRQSAIRRPNNGLTLLPNVRNPGRTVSSMHDGVLNALPKSQSNRCQIPSPFPGKETTALAY